MSFTEYHVCNSPFPVPLPPGWRCESGDVQVFYIDMDIYSFSVIRKKMKNNNFRLSLIYKNNFFLPKVIIEQNRMSQRLLKQQVWLSVKLLAAPRNVPWRQFLLGHPQPLSQYQLPVSISSLGTLSSGSRGDSASGGWCDQWAGAALI